jgi:hypothetical protein
VGAAIAGFLTAVLESGIRTAAIQNGTSDQHEAGECSAPGAQGSGAVVDGGDLVKLRLPSGQVHPDGTLVYKDAWYWTGTLPKAYPVSRRGTLYWSAIDAACPAPDGRVRFMIGPICVSATSGNDQEAYRNETLYNFYDAYSSRKPRSTYPDEYQHMVIGSRWIRLESPNVHDADVAVPLAHGSPPPGFGRYVDPAPRQRPRAAAASPKLRSVLKCVSSGHEWLAQARQLALARLPHARSVDPSHIIFAPTRAR